MRATARAPLSLRLPARRPSAPASARQRPQRAAAAPLSLSRVVRSVRLAPIAAGGEKDAARKALEQALGGGNSQMAKSFDKWADDKEKQVRKAPLCCRRRGPGWLSVHEHLAEYALHALGARTGARRARAAAAHQSLNPRPSPGPAREGWMTAPRRGEPAREEWR